MKRHQKEKLKQGTGLSNYAISKLITYSRKLHRLLEEECEGLHTEKQILRNERWQKYCIEDARKIMRRYPDLTIYFQSDCRGASIYIIHNKTAERFMNNSIYNYKNIDDYIGCNYSRVGYAIF